MRAFLTLAMVSTLQASIFKGSLYFFTHLLLDAWDMIFRVIQQPSFLLTPVGVLAPQHLSTSGFRCSKPDV